MAGLFTRIINGEIPSYKIHEDELTYSFLTIEPINPGHTLIIPKLEVDQYIDVPKEHYLKVMENSQIIGKAIREAFDPARVTLAVQGFEVNHFHLHLIPANSPADFNFKNAKAASKEDLETAQKKIIEKLNF